MPLLIGGAVGGIVAVVAVAAILLLGGGSTDSASLDLSYVPPNARTVVLHRPADLLASPLAGRVAWDDLLAGKIARLEGEAGFSLREIDTLLIVLGQTDRGSDVVFGLDQPLRNSELLAIVRFRSDVDLAHLTGGRSQRLGHGGEEFHRFTDSESGCWASGPRTVLFGAPSAIRAAIDRGEEPPDSLAADIPRDLTWATFSPFAETFQIQGFPGMQDPGWGEATDEKAVIIGSGHRLLDDGRVAQLVLWGFETPGGAEDARDYLDKSREVAGEMSRRMFGDKAEEMELFAGDMFSGAGEGCSGRILAQSLIVSRGVQAEEHVAALLGQQVDVLTILCGVSAEAGEPAPEPDVPERTDPRSEPPVGDRRRTFPTPGPSPERGRPESGELDQLTADLRSPSSVRNRSACKRLRELDPVPERRDEVVGLLTALATGGPDSARDDAMVALGVWGGAGSIPLLTSFLEGEDRSWHRPAINGLVETGSPQAVGALIDAVRDLNKMVIATEALSRLGPVAEAAVIAEMSRVEWRIRLRLCEVLSDIGSHKSLAVLRELTGNDESTHVRNAASQALDRLQARLD